MNSYRYILEPYKGINSRHTCPSCGKPKIFTRYMDAHTGQQLPEQYGRCERLNNCGYSLDPYKDGYFRQVWHTELAEQENYHNPVKQPVKPRQAAISFIPVDLYHKSRSGYEKNNFCRYLSSLFHREMALALMQRFNVGTSRYWTGATVFWQVDAGGKVRAGKVMLYNASTGKREKQVLPNGEKKSRITWVHSILRLPDFQLQQCLFGLQQLTCNPGTKPVAIVESEKDSHYSYCLPIWIHLAGLRQSY